MTFVSEGQIFVFIACVAIGAVGGVCFSFSDLIKSGLKIKALGVITDTFAFISAFIIFQAAAYFFNFPSLRIYMVVGVFLGIFLYLKSFNIILAKLFKRLYNIIRIFNRKIGGKIKKTLVFIKNRLKTAIIAAKRKNGRWKKVNSKE